MSELWIISKIFVLPFYADKSDGQQIFCMEEKTQGG
jgi:hypothetical protein